MAVTAASASALLGCAHVPAMRADREQRIQLPLSGITVT